MTKLLQKPLVLVVSLLVCIGIDTVYFPHSAVFPGDEMRFLNTARTLISTGSLNVGGDRAFEMPGTALFFVPFVYTFGDQALVPIRIAQGLLLGIQALLIGSIAKDLFGDRLKAMMATLITALYPSLLFMQGLALSETLFNTFLIAGFAALYRWRDKGAGSDFALVGTVVLFACAALTKATLTWLPPFLLAAIPLFEGRGLGKSARVFAVSAAAYCILLAPWWARNYAVLGEFIPFTTSAGLNLYLGNNPNNPHAGVNWATDTEQDRVRAMMDIPNEVERGRAFSKAATDYIRSDFRAFVERAVRKFLRYWSPIPNADTLRSIASTLISALSFAPILALALVSTIKNRHRFGALSPIYLLIGYFTFIHVIVIASIRYRIPLEPFLILLAVDPLIDGLRAVRNRFSTLPVVARTDSQART
jgi:4-amino-4-deoxy-L-arabinose transferase-like glycosyltransferase